MSAEPILDYVIRPHAAIQLARRHITRDEIRSVMTSPEQRIFLRLGQVVLQSRIEPTGGRSQMLMRIFVDVDIQPAEVVTAYRTSKIQKYWRAEE